MESEIVKEQIDDLKERMDQIETKLDASLKVMHKIEQGIFGDEEIGYPGVIKRIAALEAKIVELESVNASQDIAIKAKKGLTDDVVSWSRRLFWVGVAMLVITLLVTGKIGIGELIEKWLTK